MTTITLILWLSAFFSGVFNGIAFAALFVPALANIAETTSLPLRPIIWSMVMGVSFGSKYEEGKALNLATGNFSLFASAINTVMASILHEHAHITVRIEVSRDLPMRLPIGNF